MIPGSNLLASAFTLIGQQQAQLLKYAGTTTNAAGLSVNSYAAPAPINGSVQPMDRTRIEKSGLDTSKSYITVYTVSPIRGIGPDYPGDIVLWNGRRWQVENDYPWQEVDGWNGAVCVDLGPGGA